MGTSKTPRRLVMKALNVTKNILKICGVCLRAALIGATLPLFVVFSSLKNERVETKPHMFSTYRYVKG